jgi:hypothetical protein
MSVTLTADEALLDRLLARELFAAFGGVPGPDLSDPRSAYKPRRLARCGTPTHDAARAVRRRGVCGKLSAATPGDAAPHDAIGITTHWSANGPPAAPGA